VSSYYSSNAVYDELARRSIRDFVWASGNAWLLLYADSDEVLRLIVFVAGISSAGTRPIGSPPLAEVGRVGTALASAASVPFIKVAFDDHAPEITSVELSRDGRDEGEIPLAQLRTTFEAMGLPVKSASTAKAINDRASSAYHAWQRANLGAIKVTDVDLVRLDGQGAPIEILELKRSYIGLQQWSPYPADFTNFNLLADLADKAGARFTIVYNVRKTNPFHDDASTLSLFSYAKASGPHRIGIVTFDDFAAGRY
jgi:hypothetical protein